MTLEDDHKAYLNTFEWTAMAAGWTETQWVSILIPCLIRPAQQAVGTLPACNLSNYRKLRAVILQTRQGVDWEPQTTRNEVGGG